MDTLEQKIAKHRPPRETEDELAGGTQLRHLVYHDLMAKAMVRQRYKDGTHVVTKLTAWEILADAQRHGMSVDLPPEARRRRSRTAAAN